MEIFMATKKIIISRKEWEKAGRSAQLMSQNENVESSPVGSSNGIALAEKIVGKSFENLRMWTLIELATAWTKLDEIHLPNEADNESLAEPVTLISKEIGRRFKNYSI